MDEIVSVFIQECREQLAEMEAGLLRLEQVPDDHDNINAIFRAAHTIKGGSGVIECRYIEQFTHRVENILDKLRNKSLPVTPLLATLLLECCDQMNALVDVLAANDDAPDAALVARGEALQARLAEVLETDPAAATLAIHVDPVEVENEIAVVNTDSWHISVRFGRNVMRGGTDPLSFIRYLGEIGEIIGLETVADALPAAAEMDPEACYLGFEVRLQTKASKTDIERVFSFVQDECELRILPPESCVADYLRLIGELPEDDMRLGEMLVRVGALTQAEIDRGLREQEALDAVSTDAADTTTPLGKILVDDKVVHPAVVEAAATRQGQIVDKKTRDAQSIRVQADKLDQLIDLVGELVIAGASANLLAQKSRQGDLVEATSILSRLVENIRDAALQLRMVQIGDTFNRFHRVVRDVSKELGKDIELVINGGETELDKTVVEKIGDPLMHLVRNSLDHGIEAAELRRERGKPATGRVSLNAFHDSGSIVIEIADDGGGLDRERIRAKAVERELIAPDATLSDGEIINLIFEPGFSTADKVSNLSGRGVGMDVVRRNIQALRGSVEVVSNEGRGSTFTIRLPLTLAIIDGFLVGIDNDAYVIPLDAIVECIEHRALGAQRNYFNLRGEALPFIRLRDLFEIETPAPARESLVVVQFGGQRAGIVVDQLMGEFQTVIKPLGRMFTNLRLIGGSTILGSGDVALILDVAALVGFVSRHEEERLSISRAASSSPQLLN
ncbi:MAG: chemotaxis protein CheA [Propionivibrio sp.]|uniref:chemotaxis protein CheA n=1 Tax=Propionivibrio sp. TaxID=2212460 RepID=UPI001B562762|nr:chemotaxis protein CheA [Propionivibrio sp.]MBP7203549.1 chemotaxis protein CheA [Propionivibrio sp.]